MQENTKLETTGPTPTKILICGGRDYINWKKLRGVMNLHVDIFGMPTEVIHGDASGADKMGGLWAENLGIPVRKFPAQWKRYGKSAGYVRNYEMAEEKPDFVYAFPGGKGTAMMVKLAEQRGLQVIKIQR